VKFCENHFASCLSSHSSEKSRSKTLWNKVDELDPLHLEENKHDLFVPYLEAKIERGKSCGTLPLAG
jgi:hypothetical protein